MSTSAIAPRLFDQLQVWIWRHDLKRPLIIASTEDLDLARAPIFLDQLGYFSFGISSRHAFGYG